MQQIWNIKSRAHQCARTERPFKEKEVFYTAIYFDPALNELVRRDVALDAWKEEIAERTPIASWKTEYQKPSGGPVKPEIATRESAESLLRRLIEDDQEFTENARYILALMMERKKQLVPKEKKYTESGTMLIYEHRKTGEVFIIRDPELRLDEIEAVQEEVAMLLGFGAPGDPPPPPPAPPAPEPAPEVAAEAVAETPAAEAPPAEEQPAEREDPEASTDVEPPAENAEEEEASMDSPEGDEGGSPDDDEVPSDEAEDALGDGEEAEVEDESEAKDEEEQDQEQEQESVAEVEESDAEEAEPPEPDTALESGVEDAETPESGDGSARPPQRDGEPAPN